MKQKYAIIPLVFILLLASACTNAPARSTTTPPAVTPPAGMDTFAGNLMAQVDWLEAAMPRARSEGFVVPSQEQMTSFATLVTTLRQGKLQDAMELATAQGYQVIWFTDQNDGDAVSYLLRDKDPSKRGWGLFVFRVGSSSPLIIEAPHPLFDEGTPTLAAHLYRALEARSLLVAGAHRNANMDGSADVSAQDNSIFQAVNSAELLYADQENGEGIILQIHGFSGKKHPEYPRVIISFEHGDNFNPVDLIKGQQLLADIKAALVDQGIKTGTCGGGLWEDLCGTKNVQANLMRQGIFIHIEVDEHIRSNDARFIEALTNVFP